MNSQRIQAEEYLRAARGGWGKPEKFTAEAVFHLVALAVEGFWLAWLEDRGGAPAHHAFRDLVRAAEAHVAVPPDLKTGLLKMDQYQRLCEWIPIEPRKPTRDDLPGLLDLASRVRDFTG